MVTHISAPILVHVNLVMCIAGTSLWLLVSLPITDLRDPATVSVACLANSFEGQESPCGHNLLLSCVCVCVYLVLVCECYMLLVVSVGGC